jgi:hypothetical protein
MNFSFGTLRAHRRRSFKQDSALTKYILLVGTRPVLDRCRQHSADYRSCDLPYLNVVVMDGCLRVESVKDSCGPSIEEDV